MRSLIVVGTIALVAVLWVGSAICDDAGQTGAVAAVDLNDDSADLYLQYHGRVFVKKPDGTLDEYRWGGTSCGSRTLSDEQVAVLQRALLNPKMRIGPRSQPGQGSVKCLVGFSTADKKSIGLVP